MSGPMSRHSTGQRMSADMKSVEHNTIRILLHNICDFSWKDLMARNLATDGWRFLKSHLLTCLAFDAGYQLETWQGLLRKPLMASLFALGFLSQHVSSSQLVMLLLRDPQTRILGSEAEASVSIVVTPRSFC